MNSEDAAAITSEQGVSKGSLCVELSDVASGMDKYRADNVLDIDTIHESEFVSLMLHDFDCGFSFEL